jgi:hypothetical protein
VDAAVSSEFDFAFFPLPDRDRKLIDDPENGDDGYLNLVAFSMNNTTLQVRGRTCF